MIMMSCIRTIFTVFPFFHSPFCVPCRKRSIFVIFPLGFSSTPRSCSAFFFCLKWMSASLNITAAQIANWFVRWIPVLPSLSHTSSCWAHDDDVNSSSRWWTYTLTTWYARHGSERTQTKLNYTSHRMENCVVIFFCAILSHRRLTQHSLKCQMQNASWIQHEFKQMGKKCVHTTLELLLLVNENFLNYGAVLHNFNSVLFCLRENRETHRVPPANHQSDKLSFLGMSK